MVWVGYCVYKFIW